MAWLVQAARKQPQGLIVFLCDRILGSARRADADILEVMLSVLQLSNDVGQTRRA